MASISSKQPSQHSDSVNSPSKGNGFVSNLKQEDLKPRGSRASLSLGDEAKIQAARRITKRQVPLLSCQCRSRPNEYWGSPIVGDSLPLMNLMEAYYSRVRSAKSPLFYVLGRVMTSGSNSGSGPNLRFRLSTLTGFFSTTPLLNIDITKLQKKESSLFRCVYFGSILSTYSSSFIDIVLTLRHSVIEAWFIRFKSALLRL